MRHALPRTSPPRVGRGGPSAFAALAPYALLCVLASLAGALLFLLARPDASAPGRVLGALGLALLLGGAGLLVARSARAPRGGAQ